MEYLKAAVELLSLIKETNAKLLQNPDILVKNPNLMRLKMYDGDTNDIPMAAYSNEFVNSTLEAMGESIAFVITDIASMEVQGKEMTYILYKGYHSKIEKGLVLYQMVHKENFSPLAELQFSNMEDNIFYSVTGPENEESSCNAMETDKVIENGKSIVFFIGHMDEHRLAYDVERLIFDTANNVTKHPRLKFVFNIHIARYGGKPSDDLREKVNVIDAFTKKYIQPEYPNTTFEFSFEEDGSMS